MNAQTSPNFNERAAGMGIAYVVLHYTGMPRVQDALTRLCDPASGVSAHYVIDEAGALYPLVDEDKRAWHAGKSFWRGIEDMNSASIGIELANKGHELGYAPFPTEQIESLLSLLRDVFIRHRLPPCALLAHSDIAPTRKEDPGELFPWPLLASYGLGLWPETGASSPMRATDDTKAVALLRAIGYDTRTTGAESASQKAFLRRYHPERLAQGPDGESLARMEALARLFSL